MDPGKRAGEASAASTAGITGADAGAGNGADACDGLELDEAPHGFQGDSFAALAATVRSSHALANAVVTIPTISLFRAKLQAFILEACCCPQPMLDNIAPDRSFETILLLKKNGDDLPGTGGALWQKPNRSVVLNFVGMVDDCPVVGSLPLCKAFGCQWYINPPKEKHCASFDARWPAWCVGVTGKKEKDIETAKAKEFKLALVKNDVVFKFQYKVSFCIALSTAGCYRL